MTFSPLLLPSMTPRSSCISSTELKFREGLNRLLPDNPLCDKSNSRSILQSNQSIDQSITRPVIGMSAGSPRSDKASAALATKKKKNDYRHATTLESRTRLHAICSSFISGFGVKTLELLLGMEMKRVYAKSTEILAGV